MGRIDYYHDSAAPKANSLVPSVTAAVRNPTGELLLIHKIDNDFWALPGGAMEIGESINDAVIREVQEETNVSIELTGLVGIYTDPGHVMAYDDGEVRQEFSVCFHARSIKGQPHHDGSETKAAQWVHPDKIEKLSIHPSMRRRIEDALVGLSQPRVI
jgi:ADP-ribose pyrophosphatase YjhB (NUDIX family)